VSCCVLSPVRASRCLTWLGAMQPGPLPWESVSRGTQFVGVGASEQAASSADLQIQGAAASLGVFSFNRDEAVWVGGFVRPVPVSQGPQSVRAYSTSC